MMISNGEGMACHVMRELMCSPCKSGSQQVAMQSTSSQNESVSYLICLIFHSRIFMMGLSKTEVNLMRLLAAAPQQQNQAKLIHYVATLREQLEQLAEERTPEGLPSDFLLPTLQVSSNDQIDLVEIFNHFSNVLSER
ncbi:hypothetical protein F0562_003518 [Nyssa sinensis]|uniref:Uncharacterized protein n=1 Tax=Nyssa sinensis TaxID=561372 RepID=A0A5J5BVQ7_9ASTE|nr:hypothetical protein F0562_003518 [Nyssa sinensis]